MMCNGTHASRHLCVLHVQVWLVKHGLPEASSLICGRCERPMLLLVQLYAPLDSDDVGHDEAFHRMLYLFVCSNSKCCNKASDDATVSSNPSIVAIRCQLPRKNPIYSDISDVEIPAAEAATSAGLGDIEGSCALCGLPAPNRCSRCKVPKYCSRTHQVLHWKNGHKEACRTSTATSIAENGALQRASVLTGSVLPTWDLQIDSEPSTSERRNFAESSLPENAAKSLRDAKAGKASSVKTGAGVSIVSENVTVSNAAAGSSSSAPSRSDGEGEDEAQPEEELSIRGLSQKQIVDATGAQLFADATLRYFQARIACEPAQVVRYCRWPEGDSFAFGSSAPTQAAGAQLAAGPSTASTSNAAASQTESSNAAGSTTAATSSDDVKETDAAEAAAADAEDDEEADADGEPLGAPLWFTSAHRPASQAVIPPCANCGAERRFEFQVLPQILEYVLPGGKAVVSASSSAEHCPDMDFGTIAVYTCTKSCSPRSLDALLRASGARSNASVPNAAAGGAGASAAESTADGEKPKLRLYLPEFCWVQPSGDERLTIPEPASSSATGAAAPEGTTALAAVDEGAGAEDGEDGSGQ